MDEKARYSVKQVRFPSGERFVLAYDRLTRLPVPETTRYSAIFRRSRDGSVSTMEKDLRAVVAALVWAEEQGIDLEQRIGSVSLLTAEEILHLRDALRRNQRPGKRDLLVTAHTHYARCLYVRDYIVWRADTVVQRIPNSHQTFLPARVRLDEFRRGMIAMLPKPKGRSREGVSEEIEGRLRDVIRPDHPENPFHKQNRHRNYALLLLYLDLGVRLSEALVIKGQDLLLHGDNPTVTIHRRPDDPQDRRQLQPLVKTAGRILPLGEELRQALREWVLNHRADPKRYPGAKKSPFVFVARNGKEISKNTVYDMFVLLRDNVPGLPPDLSAHLLRHTWNDRFSETVDQEGKPEEEEKMTRNYLMGWKKHSTRAEDYTKRTTRKKADELSLKMQKKSAEGRHR
jgi:integrase